MNKPNKSITDMRKAGLAKATAFTPEQKINAQRFFEMADKAHRKALAYEIHAGIEFVPASSKELTEIISETIAKTIKADRQALKSYRLGLKGIRIGQEISHANTK